MQTRNVFAGPYLERASHLRTDPAWFESALAAAGSRVVPVWNSRSLITGGDSPRAALLGLDEIPAASRNSTDLILLGRFNGAYLFAYEFTGAEPPAVPEGARFEDGRVASITWDDYPILRFSEVPAVEIELIDAQDEPPLGLGEVVHGPTAAAIGNAVAHGVPGDFRLAEAELLHQCGLHVEPARAERRQRAGGTAEFADQHAGSQLFETLAVALERGEPGRAFVAEGDRHRLL